MIKGISTRESVLLLFWQDKLHINGLVQDCSNSCSLALSYRYDHLINGKRRKNPQYPDFNGGWQSSHWRWSLNYTSLRKLCYEYLRNLCLEKINKSDFITLVGPFTEFSFLHKFCHPRIHCRLFCGLSMSLKYEINGNGIFFLVVNCLMSLSTQVMRIMTKKAVSSQPSLRSTILWQPVSINRLWYPNWYSTYTWQPQLNPLVMWLYRHCQNFSCFTEPKMHFWQLFRISNMIT